MVSIHQLVNNLEGDCRKLVCSAGGGIINAFNRFNLVTGSLASEVNDIRHSTDSLHQKIILRIRKLLHMSKV